MSAPVVDDDLVQGAVKWLSGKPDVVAALGQFLYTDTPLLFAHKLWTQMEGTQSSAALLIHGGGWAGANIHNTVRFPRLGLEIWVDPLRENGHVSDPAEAYRRVENVFAVFDKHLHRPHGETVFWGSLRVIGSVRLAEPTVYEVPDGDGLLRLAAFYAVTQG